MGEHSKIEWCDATFNPWHGCTRVSPGCEHCYAETFSKRIGRKIWGVEADRRFFGDAHWAEPLKWNAKAEAEGRRLRVFCASMADWLEDRRDLDDQRHRLYDLIEITPALDWLLLTKRPEHFGKLARGSWVICGCPAHVSIGVTAENQQYWNRRVKTLRLIPVRTRFVSAEPLLGPIRTGSLDGINQVIVGGESGAGARRCDVAWVRSIVRQCQSAGVACFVKQLGVNVIDRNDAGFTGDEPEHWPEELVANDRIEHDIDGTRDGYQGAPVRIRLRDRKGGDLAEWPEDLRVREFPKVTA